MKVLIAYFSATNTTKKAAEKLALGLNADIYEIKPKREYTKEDLNWMNKESRSSKEMKDKTSRPEIIIDDLNLSKYDKICIGYPVWWYTAPTIINSFLEAYDLSGKENYVSYKGQNYFFKEYMLAGYKIMLCSERWGGMLLLFGNAALSRTNEKKH